jgi:3-oxoacyl-[acyl-carrier protein] reductase
MGELNNKVALVTGAGRGIGKAIATLFAKEGAFVTLNDIDERPCLETAKEIGELKAEICIADIAVPDEAKKLIDGTVERFGRLDILVNNAGITRDAAIHKMTDLQWDTCLNINLKGTFNCIRAAAKYMMKNHGGRIINLTSVVGRMGNPGQINYAAAKSGIVGLTKTVAKEWFRFGITCNAVAYGLVDTRMTAERENSEDVMGEKMGLPRKKREKLLSSGVRVISPEEAAKPVLFLASDDAAFITGTVLNASAGMYV